MKPNQVQEAIEPDSIIYGGGLLGAAIREKDWSETPLGPLEKWPTRLLGVLNTILESDFPFFLFWDAECFCFYNDAYLPSLGKDYDYRTMLGAPANVMWAGELFETIIEPQVAAIKNGTPPIRYTDQLTTFFRDGKMDDVYWTYSYSGVRNNAGTIQGVLVTCMETTEKVNAFSALEKSSNQLHFALEAANLATWEWLPNDGIFTGNKRFYKWFDKKRNVPIDQTTLLERVHPEDRKRVLRAIKLALNNKNSPHYQVVQRLLRRKGGYRVVRATGKVYFDESDKPTRFNGVMQDISKKYYAESEQRKLLSLFENSNELIILTDRNGVITHFNQAAEKVLGTIKKDSSRIIDYIHEDDFIRANIILEDFQKYAKLFLELRFINNQTSRETWMITNFTVINDTETGKLSNIAISGSNITKIKQNELLLEQYNVSLKQSESRFKEVADNTPAFIYLTTVDGQLLFANKSLRAFLGADSEGINDSILDGYIYEDDLPAYKAAYEKSIRQADTFRAEYRLRCHDGSYLWVSNVGVPKYDLNSNFEGYTHATMIIHDLKTQEEQKDLFIGMASHELNTPVTSIKGYIQLLLLKYGNDSDAFLNRTLQTVDTQVSVLTDLIKDMLDLSKMKAGGLELKLTKFNFRTFIEDIIDQQQIINPEHIYNFNGILDVEVVGDRERLKQVLINFLSNAIKYAPESNKIEITVEVCDRALKVSVTDFGIGINKINQEKVFKRFYREEGSDEKTFPGFGIGLYIAADIIYKHKGSIGVTSVKGKGSTFYFELPKNLNLSL